MQKKKKEEWTWYYLNTNILVNMLIMNRLNNLMKRQTDRWDKRQRLGDIAPR
jgi:hypothetical protein